MTTYFQNIHYTDTRTSASLKDTLDLVFAKAPGAALKGKITGCSGKKVTVKYEPATKPEDIKTNGSGDVLTELSYQFYRLIPALAKRPSPPTSSGPTAILSDLTNELTSLGGTSAVTGAGLAAQAGKGPDAKLKWTYPTVPRRTLGSLFADLLGGSQNVWQVAQLLTGGTISPQTVIWCMRLGADLHLGLHGDLNAD
ncbi:MAG: hypothetical protein JSW66_06690, partial [Phycisphaerales bacterium]